MKDLNAIHSFQANRSLLKIHHILSHKTNLNTYPQISILLRICSDYNAIKLEINDKKITFQIFTFLKFQDNSWVEDDIMEIRSER